ncbi:MAG: hypothetical protein M1830_006938 [Pleopsidium flavum]|nr:MAG: hypothetical protein M1830_002990 [Pleopsidium flavum]KAI9876245.1 MAG: hypothetical protein M1830_006938 [Pleopsidium flavum]
MLSQAAAPSNIWSRYDDSVNHLNLSAVPQNHLGHKRASSSSSAGSVGPASPYNQTTSYPEIAQSDTPSLSPSGSDGYEANQTAYSTFSKPLPTPENSPPQESFLAPAFQNYNPSTHNPASHMAAHIAMKQALMEHHGLPEDDSSAFSYSGGHSVSSMGHDSPMTPRNTYTEEFDEGTKAPLNDYHSQVPKLDRTMSDIYQDELFIPASTSAISAPIQHARQTPTTNKALLSPYRTVFSERLQAANNSHLTARSQSPANTISRQRSPFREGSPYAGSVDSFGSQSSPQARLGSAAQIREQQKAQADALALAQHQPSIDDMSTPKTISPKDAVLDYHESEEDANMPLFPPNNSAIQYEPSQYPGSSNPPENIQSDIDDNITEQSYNSMATSRRQSSSNYSTSTAALQPTSTFNFVPPSVPGSVHMPQQYPFIAQQQRRQESNMRSASDQTPEFPAHLTSMESSASDAGMTDPSNEIKRPSNTMADSGTYTCTYHGCTLRFETPAKLQKHKREGHRQSTPQVSISGNVPGNAGTGVSGGVSGGGSGMTSAALMRNSQAGPHKCERINPSTGKPCNTIFSRPYDLTRHEDTIHNARKQKVRCHLCTEEKTFSRNDALTRHMRVVHPEIDFPGKTRRRHHD